MTRRNKHTMRYEVIGIDHGWSMMKTVTEGCDALSIIRKHGRQMPPLMEVDADACPVVRIVEQVAKKNNIPVMLLCDTNHVLTSDYSEVKMIGAGADAVDFALINLCVKSDIVVTQDYGVAAMALGKGAYAIHQSGKWYTNDM
jgi:hypothetical protein